MKKKFTLKKKKKKEMALDCLSHSSSPFALDIFKIGSQELFAQSWLPTKVLLISAS
jgi:hypothetical protein